MAAAREIALDVLYACHHKGAWADGALRRELSRAKLNPRDAALASRLTYGVLQNQLLLDHFLSALVKRPLEQTEAKVLEVLRLGAYQLLFTDKIPARAAVNEGVELTRRWAKRPGATSLVNAVLRGLDRTQDHLPQLPADPLERLSIQYSHPLWLVKEFALTLGLEETQALLAADNAPSPMAVQVNTLKGTCQGLIQSLEREGAVPLRHPWMEDCLLLEHTGDLEESPAFRQGLFYVQDPAAKAAVLAARPRPGERVLDLCAAPGGKTFAAAMEMGDSGHILSRDIYPRKVAEMTRTAARLGLASVETQVWDARKPPKTVADLVIADVPCSGLGIIRKKPDIRYKDPSLFQALLPIQAKILENAAQATSPGGRLLYATCTLRKEENQDQVIGFLEKYPQFSLVKMETLWPHRHRTDGFFYAVLKR